MHAGIVCALLVVLSAGSLAIGTPLHKVEGRFLESQHAWQLALDEYQRAGATAPHSTDLARVYNEWGDALAAQGHYGLAVGKFEVVVQDYAAVTQQVNRAERDLVTTYFAWTRAALDQQDYLDAESAIGSLLGLPSCDASCQNDAAPLAVTVYLQAAQDAVQVGQYATAIQGLETLLAMPVCDVACQSAASAQEATAYYQEAESYLTAGSASLAVSAFQVILARFPSAPEAKALHPDLAKALLQVGEQQLHAACASAIPTYQNLATHFLDTPEGKQAAAALAAPQPVTGHLTKAVPVGVGVTLTWGLHAGMTFNEVNTAWTNGYHFDYFIFRPGDGNFRLAPVPPGTYDLLWYAVAAQQNFGFEFATNPDGSPTYVAHVQPLCPFDFGDIPEDFPNPYG
jgi:tetratricopeptide (TPR) repeat protein